MAEVEEEQPKTAEEEVKKDEEEVQLPFGKRFKRTLDSDEDDDELEDAEKYRMDEFEGTEKSTIEFDGDIKITPFNMDEELETGHFDTEGTYIFKKDDDIRDNWLDNIDWGRVNRPEGETTTTAVSSEKVTETADESGEDPPKTNTDELYKQVIEVLRPGETIQRAIQRYGKDCPKVKKGIKRKVESEKNSSTDDSKVAAAKENIMKLTSIADQFLHSGDMDIYERRFEEFQLHLNRSKAPDTEPSVEDDMFSDAFDPTKAPKPTTSTSADKSADPMASATVTWQFKWEDSEDAPVHGPFQSDAMQAWVDNGYFKDGVFVRRSDSKDARFYSSKRIDFELYI